ncbi:hypothetical protein PMAYCL1PPCAC_24025 [Pristionchus mayeri]|uniref:Uncharacterized protein n=1 Tax=Pristionchus mayeri TaxID=1317129 RepID=A0AAN5D0Y7_9BILA|nr:hypothetical protein PMAYCL1PPCAC_24025 [Pristionchus mayeri]
MFFVVLLILLSSVLSQGQDSKKNEPTIGVLKNQSIRPCEGSRANDSNCAVHVFRVVLSSKPSENGNEPVRSDKIIFANAKKNAELSKEIAGKIPHDLSEPMRKSMKNVIENEGFYLRELESDSSKDLLKSDDRLITHSSHSPSRFVPLREDHPQIQSVVVVENGLLPFLSSSFSVWWILILVAGILLGVLSTVICLLLIDYRSKPRMDRSSQMVFRKWSGYSSMERQGQELMPVSNYYTPHYRAPPPPLVARSISTTTASNSHPNYVNAFIPLDNESLSISCAAPPLPRAKDTSRGMRNQGISYEMQLYTNVNEAKEGRGRSSSASIR